MLHKHSIKKIITKFLKKSFEMKRNENKKGIKKAQLFSVVLFYCLVVSEALTVITYKLSTIKTTLQYTKKVVSGN